MRHDERPLTELIQDYWRTELLRQRYRGRRVVAVDEDSRPNDETKHKEKPNVQQVQKGHPIQGETPHGD